MTDYTRFMAERVGFEPTIRFPVYTLSKRAPSATRPSLPWSARVVCLDSRVRTTASANASSACSILFTSAHLRLAENHSACTFRSPGRGSASVASAARRMAFAHLCPWASTQLPFLPPSPPPFSCPGFSFILNCQTELHEGAYVHNERTDSLRHQER
jgi:hypothetical protein